MLRKMRFGAPFITFGVFFNLHIKKWSNLSVIKSSFMQKIEVKIEVKSVFKCAKPAMAHLYMNETDPTNTQDPTTTLTSTTSSALTIIPTIFARS